MPNAIALKRRKSRRDNHLPRFASAATAAGNVGFRRHMERCSLSS